MLWGVDQALHPPSNLITSWDKLDHVTYHPIKHAHNKARSLCITGFAIYCIAFIDSYEMINAFKIFSNKPHYPLNMCKFQDISSIRIYYSYIVPLFTEQEFGNVRTTLSPQYVTSLWLRQSDTNANEATSSNRNISASLAICAGNSPVTGEFPAQRPVMRSFDVFFDLHRNKRV